MDRIERAIGKAIQPLLKQHGFELRKDWGYFVREQPYGRDAMYVINQGTALGRFFEIGCHPSIRHNRVEIPWNTLGLVYGDDGQKQTSTLVLGFPRGLHPPPLKVFSESMAADVTNVAHEVESVFVQKALPFYQRFADLKEIEQLANRVPLAELLPYTVGGPLEDRAMRSLLLAKAVNPERYSIVREAFLTTDKKTLFPRERCMQMLKQVDEIVI